MFFPEAQLKVWLYTRPTDMRKSFDGLSSLVKEKLAENPLSGQLFVFVNRRGNYLKALYFDRSGYALWAKRLEQGRFHYRDSAVSGDKVSLNVTELKLMLEGIDVRATRRYKRYRHRTAAASAL